MKYRNEIIINLPREAVIKKLDNPENMKHWQRGLVGYEQLNQNEPGAVGAKMKLEYKTGKRSMVMTETIVKNDFPSEFHATYEANGVFNTQQYFFEEVDSGTTRWISDSEFKFSSFGMKVLGFLMPGAFKKQSMKYLNDFKNFAEKGTSVADE